MEGERYAYSFFGSGSRRVAFGRGVLLLPPAQETVDPAHVVSELQVCLCHSCSMQMQGVRGQAGVVCSVNCRGQRGLDCAGSGGVVRLLVLGS